jgi:hypothetical protein
MGSYVELNDTLQITPEQGFPVEILNYEKHKNNPIGLKEVGGKVFEFKNKSKARIYHSPPTRCFLAQNLNGKWLYWGKVIILEQTISSDKNNNQTTSGKYKITEIYDPIYQEQFTKHESPEGLSYL